MDHADAEVHRVARRAHRHLFAVQQDLAAVAAGLLNDGHSEQNVHQRGFACAVLAEQRVNLARPDVQVHALEHGVSGILLADVFHLQGVCFVHFHSSTLLRGAGPAQGA